MTTTGIGLRAADGPRRSRLGGPGVLPAGEPWPRTPDGRPLAAVAALDLAELPPVPPLPRAGTLACFWDTEVHRMERMDFVAATRVHLVEGEPEPAAPPDDAVAVEALAVEATSGEPARHRLLGTPQSIQGPVLDEVAYWLDQAFPATAERFTAAERAGDGWTLLLQLGPEPALPHLVLGDAGRLFVLVPDADLRAGRFDRAMGILQSA